MDTKNISLVTQEIFSTIDGNLESIISLFPLQYKRQYDAISYIINHLNNIRIQPQESQSLINELEEELKEITELTNAFKELKKLTEAELLQICTEIAELIKNNTLEEINTKIEYFAKISESELEKEYQTKITETQHKAVEQKEQSKEDLEKALEEYLEKKYVLLLNSKNSEEEQQEIIAKYKKEVESLNKENRRNLQNQKHTQRTGKEITNIEEHKLVKAGILTQEEIISYYELLNTLGEYSSITEEDNEETSLVKKLFDAARNFYENNPTQGLQELMEIPYQKASELDRIDNIVFDSDEDNNKDYNLLTCMIACGGVLTLQKLINENKIDNFKKEELDLVVALFKKDTEILSKNHEIKLNNEIGKFLLKTSKPTYELKELIPFINIRDLGNEVFVLAALQKEIDIMKKVDKEIITSEYISEALTISIYTNNIEIITYLLSLEKTNINEKNANGYTPLYLAFALNKFEMVELLLTHESINVNEKDAIGNTPLHQANNYNYFPIVELLLSHKDINIHKKNSHNDTPLDLATNKPEIVKLLNDYKESHKVSTISQDQEVQILGEEYNCNAFDGA